MERRKTEVGNGIAPTYQFRVFLAGVGILVRGICSHNTPNRLAHRMSDQTLAPSCKPPPLHVRLVCSYIQISECGGLSRFTYSGSSPSVWIISTAAPLAIPSSPHFVRSSSACTRCSPFTARAILIAVRIRAFTQHSLSPFTVGLGNAPLPEQAVGVNIFPAAGFVIVSGDSFILFLSCVTVRQPQITRSVSLFHILLCVHIQIGERRQDLNLHSFRHPIHLPQRSARVRLSDSATVLVN